MKKTLLLFAAAALFSCNSESGKSTTDSTAADANKVAAKPADSTQAAKKPDAAAANNGAWSYSTDTDKMTSKLDYFAEIEAKDVLNFSAPYDGGSTASLIIRNKAKQNDVMLKVSKGQFNAGTEGESIKIRFDNDQPVTYTATEPSDGSTDALFIGHESTLIKKLKTAQKIIIEAEFYEDGLKTMEFAVKDLKWDH